MCGIGALEVLRRCPRDPIRLPPRDQQMEMRLLPRPTDRRWTVESVGHREPVSGNRADQIAHEIHVLARTELEGQRELPFFKRIPIGPFIALRGPEVGVRTPLGPGRQIP